MHKSEIITAHLPFFIFEKKKAYQSFPKNFPFSVHAKPSIALWVFLILSLAGNYNELAAYKGSMLLFRTIPQLDNVLFKTLCFNTLDYYWIAKEGSN